MYDWESDILGVVFFRRMMIGWKEGRLERATPAVVDLPCSRRPVRTKKDLVALDFDDEAQYYERGEWDIGEIKGDTMMMMTERPHGEA